MRTYTITHIHPATFETILTEVQGSELGVRGALMYIDGSDDRTVAAFHVDRIVSVTSQSRGRSGKKSK